MHNAAEEAIINLFEDDYKIKIKGISFIGQIHSLVALDENDFIIRPAILSNNVRSNE